MSWAIYLKIQRKISLLLLLISSGLVGLLFFLIQWSFDRGLLEYANQRQQAQVAILQGNLVKAYQDKGSWAFFDGRHRLWHDMLKAAQRGQDFDLLLEMTDQRYQSRQGRPPRREHHNGFRPPPRHQRFSDEHTDLRADSRRPPPRDRQGPPPHGHRQQGSERGPDARPDRQPPRNAPALAAADGSVLIGQARDDWQKFPVELEGQVIAYILKPALNRLTDESDLAFRDSQHYAFGAISLVVLGLSILLALPVARHFVGPLQRVMATVSALAKGQYQTRSNIQRDDELGQLNRDVNELAKVLENNEQARNRWVAAVAHELRTPLAIARGEIEAMRDGVRPMNDKGLASLDQELARLHRLSDDLSELFGAELGALRYQKHSVDLVELLEQAASRHASDFTARGFQFKLLIPEDLDAYVWADAVRLDQLFDNLLHNTVKYALEGAKVHLGCTVKNNQVMISLSDSGPGVSAQARSQLFDYLYRVEDSRNRNTGGSGLGLAICKAIVEAHDGSIKACESSLGGLAMTIKLPLLTD